MRWSALSHTRTCKRFASRAGADETPVDTTSKIVTLPTGQRITKTLEASLMLTFWLAASSSSDSSSSAASKRPFHS